jgi:poly(A) polymerase
MLNWIIRSFKVKKDTPLRVSDPRISQEDIDPDALKVIHRLQQHNFKAYVVGGAVRDRLLGIKPKDCDVVTSARPNEIRQLFRNAFIIGRRFRLVHVKFRMNKVIETATFRRHHGQEEGTPVEADNVFGTEEDDAFRRDFTLNALFYDPFSNQIIDYVGGLKDIEDKKIRCLGDPQVRLMEDPVRILRAIKFAAKFNLRMEGNLDKSIHKLKDNIKLCSQRRLYEELLKILRLGVFEAFVRKADEYGFLHAYLPFFHAYWQRNREETLQLARAIDHYSAQKPNEPHFLFCLLLWPRVNEKFRACGDIQKAVRMAFGDLNSILPLSKLDKIKVRMILGLLPRFEFLMNLRSKKRRYMIRKFVRTPFFREALELLRALETIEQGDTPGFRFWSEELNRPQEPRENQFRPAQTRPEPKTALPPAEPETSQHQGEQAPLPQNLNAQSIPRRRLPPEQNP